MEELLHEPCPGAFAAHFLCDPHRREAAGAKRAAAGDQCDAGWLAVREDDAAGGQIHAVLAEHRQELGKFKVDRNEVTFEG
ncbi:MAG: hypothetical protein MZV64_59770 [Ignavibacteriales bacterium]|nr:hypothetical protein [Ignavibacteriales bacterium]